MRTCKQIVSQITCLQVIEVQLDESNCLNEVQDVFATTRTLLVLTFLCRICCVPVGVFFYTSWMKTVEGFRLTSHCWIVPQVVKQKGNQWNQQTESEEVNALSKKSFLLKHLINFHVRVRVNVLWQGANRRDTACQLEIAASLPVQFCHKAELAWATCHSLVFLVEQLCKVCKSPERCEIHFSILLAKWQCTLLWGLNNSCTHKWSNPLSYQTKSAT